MTPLDPADLPALIAQGESETLEFKRSTAELDQVVQTVAALANTRGGRVLIGVGSDGRIAGVDIGQVTLERVANQITGNTDPKIYPSLEVITAGERAVIVITVTESDDKPHEAAGRAWVLAGLVATQAPPADLAAAEAALRARIAEAEERIARGKTLLETETDPARVARYRARLAELTAQVNACYDQISALRIDSAFPG